MKTERNHLFTCQELSDKDRRSLSMYDLIRKKGVISRAEIAKLTGINAVSVSGYVNNFIEKGMILEKGFDVSTGGRKPELVELNSESNYVIGIDVGKSEIRGASADIGLNVKIRKQISRPIDREVSTAVIRLIEDIIGASKITTSHVKAIGLGISDQGLDKLAGEIKNKTGIDTFLGPSAACAAFAEKRINHDAENFDDILYVYSDVGEGVMLSDNTCLTASEDEKSSDDKLRYLMPWDDYLSIAENARREVARGVGTKIVSIAGGKIDNITGQVVISAAKAGDEVALSIVLGTGINLGLRIAYLVNLFSPAIIVIGGGIQDAGDIVFQPIKKMVERLAYRDRLKNLKIIPSALDEDAVDIGAASLAVREIFIKS